MLNKRLILAAFSVGAVAVAVVACGADSTTDPQEIGNSENGKLLYELGPEGVYEPFCANCHTLTDAVLFRPGFEGLGERAATEQPGSNAGTFLELMAAARYSG